MASRSLYLLFVCVFISLGSRTFFQISAMKSQRHEGPDQPLPKAEPSVARTEDLPPYQLAQTWLDNFAHIATNGDVSQLHTVFHIESWWRDHLALDKDNHTVHGLRDIKLFLHQKLATAQLHSFKLTKNGQFMPSISSTSEGLIRIESMFSFESKIGSGKGMLGLTLGADGVYKCHAVYLSLQELKRLAEGTALQPLDATFLSVVPVEVVDTEGHKRSPNRQPR